MFGPGNKYLFVSVNTYTVMLYHKDFYSSVNSKFNDDGRMYC